MLLHFKPPFSTYYISINYAIMINPNISAVTKGCLNSNSPGSTLFLYKLYKYDTGYNFSETLISKECFV